MTWAWNHNIRLMLSFLHTADIISYHLAYSPCILYIDLKLATILEALPSTCHIHLECWPYRQDNEQLYSIILQQALSCVPIGQYRSYDPLFFIPCKVYLVLLPYPLLNISLSLNYGTTEPRGLQAPLYIVFVLSLTVMVLVWYYFHVALQSHICSTYFNLL